MRTVKYLNLIFFIISRLNIFFVPWSIITGKINFFLAQESYLDIDFGDNQSVCKWHIFSWGPRSWTSITSVAVSNHWIYNFLSGKPKWHATVVSGLKREVLSKSKLFSHLYLQVVSRQLPRKKTSFLAMKTSNKQNRSSHRLWMSYGFYKSIEDWFSYLHIFE